MPEDKDFLALQGVLGLVDVLCEVLTVVGDFGPHVVDEEGLREVEFVIRVRHGLEVERHGRTALHVPNLVLSDRRVAVGVKELGDGLAVLGEERVVEAPLPLLIVIYHVVRLRREESAQLLVAEKVVQHVHLVDGRLSSLVPDPRRSDQARRHEMNFPERCMRAHHKREAGPAEQAPRPHVVAAVQTRAYLVEVVTGAHPPLPVVRVDHICHVFVLRGVPLGFNLQKIGQDGSDIIKACLVTSCRKKVSEVLLREG